MSTFAEPVSRPDVLNGIVERTEDGLIILSPTNRPPHRRVLFVNSYGGAAQWAEIKLGLVAPHHLWGCLELVRRGYEVALAHPLPDFYLYRNPLPHDLKFVGFVRRWLGKDGIIYCGHNVLYWTPLLRALGALRCCVVSLLFAREPLDWSRAHSGIVALTTAAAEHARLLAPKAKVAHLGWGADLSVFPSIEYRPRSFLSCGRTQRDHAVLAQAATLSQQPIRVIASRIPDGLSWPDSVQFVGQSREADVVEYSRLLHEYYAECTAALVVLKYDAKEYTAVGMTNVIEAMAMARPVIVTRTGALPTEIDVEKVGCGICVPPDDAGALAEAITTLAADPKRAAGMGKAGRALCERHYNIERYATQLDQFFATL